MEAQWRKEGWQVISPAQTSIALGYTHIKMTALSDKGTPDALSELDKYLRHVMAVDLLSVANCDIIALLNDWHKSLGATVELAYAQFLGMDVYCAHNKLKLLSIKTPWDRLRIINGLLH